jgi:hypothetical protein
LKGKEAKGGDYIMEGFLVPSEDGEFALSKMRLMKEFIESKVDINGVCD